MSFPVYMQVISRGRAGYSGESRARGPKKKKENNKKGTLHLKQRRDASPPTLASVPRESHALPNYKLILVTHLPLRLRNYTIYAQLRT